MAMKGINFWYIPANLNQPLLDDIRELINAQIIAERLLGN